MMIIKMAWRELVIRSSHATDKALLHHGRVHGAAACGGAHLGCFLKQRRGRHVCRPGGLASTAAAAAAVFAVLEVTGEAAGAGGGVAGT